MTLFCSKQRDFTLLWESSRRYHRNREQRRRLSCLRCWVSAPWASTACIWADDGVFCLVWRSFCPWVDVASGPLPISWRCWSMLCEKTTPLIFWACRESLTMRASSQHVGLPSERSCLSLVSVASGPAQVTSVLAWTKLEHLDGRSSLLPLI